MREAAHLQEGAPVAAPEPPVEVEEAPPFLGTWRNVYAFVIGELVVTIALFWALTRWAS